MSELFFAADRLFQRYEMLFDLHSSRLLETRGVMNRIVKSPAAMSRPILGSVMRQNPLLHIMGFPNIEASPLFVDFAPYHIHSGSCLQHGSRAERPIEVIAVSFKRHVNSLAERRAHRARLVFKA